MSESRVGILAAISTWLRLLALVVLAAEAVILAAMAMTPESNPLAPWYPVFMLLFLLVLVVGVFWDQHTKNISGKAVLPVPTPSVGGKKVFRVDTLGKSITPEEVKKLDISTEFIEQRLGFTFHRPKLPNWSEPRVLTRDELLKEKGIKMSREASEVEQIARANPLVNMIIEAKFFVLTCGDPIDIHLTDMTSTRLVDKIVEATVSELEEDGEEVDKKDITAIRKRLVKGELTTDRITVQNCFIVQVHDKALAKTSLVEPNLANVFITIMRSAGEYVGTLDAGKDSILWSTSSTLSNVMISKKSQEITTYRLYRLTESKSKFFLVQIEYSPQTGLSPDVWRDLNDMLSSFNMIS